jgi:DNA-binding beta-propeller fold protein YncE
MIGPTFPKSTASRRGVTVNGSRVAALGLAVVLAFGCRGDRNPAPPSRIAARDTAPHPDTTNVYAATGVDQLAPRAAAARPLVYVPNSHDGTVTVIDPRSYRALRTFATGALPQHVVPSYDLKTLWVANNLGNTLTPIDPVTGREGRSVPVDDPYNLYFTPDGRFAIVVAERLRRLDFRDPHTMALVQSVPVPCKGVDHMEFTADARFAVATCEFSGQLVKVDLAARAVVAALTLDPDGLGSAAMPQDIRSAPDGRVFYVADMRANGVFLVDPVAFRRIGFVATGKGTHGIYPSRDGRLLYITNRGWNTTAGGRRGPGTITVLDPQTQRIVATWPVPGGGSPDMGNVSADGRELWLSGRYDNEVYVFDTVTGALLHRIRVGREPHGLCVWPVPGRYSLGHTGNMR